MRVADFQTEALEEDLLKYYNPIRHVVILTLIQLGGLGITTLSTALFLLFGQRASLSTHDVVESSFRVRPEGKMRPLLVQVFVWTVTIEAVGAALLLLNTIPEPSGFWSWAARSWSSPAALRTASSAPQRTRSPGWTVSALPCWRCGETAHRVRRRRPKPTTGSPKPTS